jgi:hypothetical protein
MPTPLRASIPHNLGKAEARRRIQEGAANLQTQPGGMMGLVAFNHRAEGDRLHLEGIVLGQRITGRIDVEDQAVLVEVDVPTLLASLAEKIKGTITQGAQKLLERK